jgi:hypothetical protein
MQMQDNDSADPGRQELTERERAQERLAREAAADAETEEEARINLRRADKAQYLREKLEEQARADEESGS